jgi:hypothetical protein
LFSVILVILKQITTEINGGLLMDNSKEWKSMLDGAIEQYPLEFQEFDKTKNLQDQIQEMMGNFSPDKDGYSELLHDFNQFIEFEETMHFKTFEQLWLAFYMYEKQGKIWSGRKWVVE